MRNGDVAGSIRNRLYLIFKQTNKQIQCFFCGKRNRIRDEEFDPNDEKQMATSDKHIQ